MDCDKQIGSADTSHVDSGYIIRYFILLSIKSCYVKVLQCSKNEGKKEKKDLHFIKTHMSYIASKHGVHSNKLPPENLKKTSDLGVQKRVCEFCVHEDNIVP